MGCATTGKQLSTPPTHPLFTPPLFYTLINHGCTGGNQENSAASLFSEEMQLREQSWQADQELISGRPKNEFIWVVHEDNGLIYNADAELGNSRHLGMRWR